MGFSCGIWVTWKSEVVQVRVIEESLQFCHVEICYPGEEEWFCTFVYATPNDAAKRELWEKFEMMSHVMVGQWIVIGDFNDIRTPEEKWGGAHVNLRRCEVFEKRINDCGLIRVGLDLLGRGRRLGSMTRSLRNLIEGSVTLSGELSSRKEFAKFFLELVLQIIAPCYYVLMA